MTGLRRLLEHPLTRGMDLDDPNTTALRQHIIQEKPFLRCIYNEWYQLLSGWVGNSPSPILEMGSGAGFVKQYLPDTITSDIICIPGLSLACSALQLPFDNQKLGGILMVNVFHHLPDSRHFFSEAIRCLRPGGVIAMIEPWKTPWSTLVYSRLHHEPFDPQAKEWKCEPGKPLSSANGALSWIIFHRDVKIFNEDFPDLQIEIIKPMMPLVYLLSGGVSLRSLMPGWSYRIWRAIEKGLYIPENNCSMFALIVLKKFSP